jgi:hypothetical protein
MEKTRNEKILIGVSLYITFSLIYFGFFASNDEVPTSSKATSNPPEIKATPKEKAPPTPKAPTLSEKDQVKKPEIKPAPIEKAPSTPKAPTLSEKDQIKKLVTDQLSGQNNMKKDNLKNLVVIEQEDGGWNVEIGFNADDNFSMNLIKTGIETQMSKLYIALFNSGKDIKTVSISAYFPLEDQYGNVNDRVVYASTLNNEEANKVNWNANRTSLEHSILPGVWTTTMLHPEFNK